jgi:hypothetical protein
MNVTEISNKADAYVGISGLIYQPLTREIQGEMWVMKVNTATAKHESGILVATARFGHGMRCTHEEPWHL